MNQIIKLLNIIQAALSLAERELIVMQLPPLRQFAEACADDAVGSQLLEIVVDLERGEYATAEQAIAQFLQARHQVLVYDDVELAALRMEMAQLEQEVARLQQLKEDYFAELDDFNRQYYDYLGEKLEKILQLTAELAKRRAEETKKATQKQREAEAESKRAEEAYEQFKEEENKRKQEPKSPHLDDDLSQRLKQAYRQASRLCHPDMMLRHAKREAVNILNGLAEAYHTNNWRKAAGLLADWSENGALDICSAQAKHRLVDGNDEVKQRAITVFRRLVLACHAKNGDQAREVLATWEQAGVFNQTSKHQNRLFWIQWLAEELQKKYTSTFQRLSDAYRKKDVKKVEAILAELLSNKSGKERNISPEQEKQQIRQYIAHLRRCIEQLERELAELAQDETYQLVVSLAGDYEAYFDEMGQILDEEIDSLLMQLGEKKSEQKSVVDDIDDDIPF